MLKGGYELNCRVGCGACCMVISISSPIPGMPEGKPAGIPCVQLTDDNKCALFDKQERPDVCRNLRASQDMCGTSNEEAFVILEVLEKATQPLT
jgi:Fe-S-cluster containining protein